MRHLVFSALAFLTVLIADTRPATSLARDPNAEIPANIGIIGNRPPTLGIGITLGLRIFRFPPFDLSDLRAVMLSLR